MQSQRDPLLWLSTLSKQVVEMADHAVVEYSTSSAQAQLLQALIKRALHLSPRGGEYGLGRIAIHLPLQVSAAVKGDIFPPAVTLATALLLLEVGIYTFDHVLDSELESGENAVDPRMALLGACSLLSYMPHHLLLQIQSENPTVGDALLRQLAEGMSVISSGQLADMAEDYSSSSASIEQVVSLKTGARRRLYAAMSATLAGASSVQIDAYSSYAASLGKARQIYSDIFDLFGAGRSRDLASGTVTLPLAMYLEMVSPEENLHMRSLLSASRKESALQGEIRTLLRSAGVLRAVAARIETHCQAALSYLREAKPFEIGGLLLRSEVSKVSLVS